jgi:hypothetical protein
VSGIGYDNEGIPDNVNQSNLFTETIELWNQAGYKTTKQGGSAEWHMFYPGINFDERAVDTFCNLFSISNYKNCWISMILPGKFCPWHVDQYDADTQSLRYHCHIGKPEMGHVFMLEHDYFIKQQQGDTFLWHSASSWHCGVNAGTTPKFMLNVL